MAESIPLVYQEGSSRERGSQIMKLLVLIAQLLACSAVYAKDISVFDVRRPLSFENGQELPKDYYVNAGIEVGLKVGMSIAVNRRQTLYDPFQNKSPGDLIIPVGRLKIIQVQDNIAVARLEQIMGRENLPVLDFDAIMVGDDLDMSTAKMSAGKRAETETPEKAEAGEATNASTEVITEVQPVASFALPTTGPTL